MTLGWGAALNQEFFIEMNLPDQAIIEFQEIYLSEFGVKITFELAKELSSDLFNLFSAIYRPIPKDILIKKTRKGSTVTSGQARINKTGRSERQPTEATDIPNNS